MNENCLSLQDNKGWTPLHYAANHGCLIGINYLLSVGADPDVADNEGREPSDLVSSEYSSEVKERLLEAQSSIGCCIQ